MNELTFHCPIGQQNIKITSLGQTGTIEMLKCHGCQRPSLLGGLDVLEQMLKTSGLGLPMRLTVINGVFQSCADTTGIPESDLRGGKNDQWYDDECQRIARSIQNKRLHHLA